MLTATARASWCRRRAHRRGCAPSARVYLQNLVDQIVIGEDEIVVEAKAGAALAMMAASRSAASESTSGEVLADVVDWRPNGDGSKNLRLALPNPTKRPEPPPPKPPELPRIVRVLELARRWQGILDRGGARTRDDLAKLTGLGSRYVGNILELLRLPPAILEAIERLPVGAGNEVTERWLRPIARLPHDEQLTAVAERLDLSLEEDCR